MKTTREIHQMYEMNNESERDISNDKWFSEEEIRQVIRRICLADLEIELYKSLFGIESKMCVMKKTRKVNENERNKV